MSKDKKDKLVLAFRNDKPEVVEDQPLDLVITFRDGTTERVPAESFAETTDLPGFIVAWDDNPYVLKGFWNLKDIRSIKLKEKEDIVKVVYPEEIEDAYFSDSDS